MGPESPKVLTHICIRPKDQTEDVDMFEDEHAVSQRPTAVGEEDSVNCNTLGDYAKDKPFLD